MLGRWGRCSVLGAYMFGRWGRVNFHTNQSGTRTSIPVVTKVKMTKTRSPCWGVGSGSLMLVWPGRCSGPARQECRVPPRVPSLESAKTLTADHHAVSEERGAKTITRTADTGRRRRSVWAARPITRRSRLPAAWTEDREQVAPKVITHTFSPKVIFTHLSHLHASLTVSLTVSRTYL